MNILVIGSGGREHALCWKLAKSPQCEKLYAAPGNGGISEVAELVNISADDVDKLLAFAKEKNIGLTVVGPEVPLVKGIVDSFLKAGLKIFGPSREPAQLEGSKAFSKEFMKRCGIPTADFKIFTDPREALPYLDKVKMPIVVKADGLCAGKGVVVAKTREEAREAATDMLIEKVFGAAGLRIIVEECLVGEEASVLVVSDGKSAIPLASSQDHKRIYDGDRGPNTGGMGAYSPAPVMTDEMLKRVMSEVIDPAIKTFVADGKPFKGILYAGIMVTAAGPKVLEFNVRFGDPETQAILPRLKSDLVELFLRSIDGKFEGYGLEWDNRPCVTVVIAAGGYPGKYRRGMEIHGIDEANKVPDTMVFSAGTKLGSRATDGKHLLIASGGRVLNVTSLGDNIEEAIKRSYDAVGFIQFDNMTFRRDIGSRAIGRK